MVLLDEREEGKSARPTKNRSRIAPTSRYVSDSSWDLPIFSLVIQQSHLQQSSSSDAVHGRLCIIQILTVRDKI